MMKLVLWLLSGCSFVYLLMFRVTSTTWHPVAAMKWDVAYGFWTTYHRQLPPRCILVVWNVRQEYLGFTRYSLFIQHCYWICPLIVTMCDVSPVKSEIFHMLLNEISLYEPYIPASITEKDQDPLLSLGEARKWEGVRLVGKKRWLQ